MAKKAKGKSAAAENEAVSQPRTPVPLEMPNGTMAQLPAPYPIRAAAAWTWRILPLPAGVYARLWVMGAFKTIAVPVLVAMLLPVLLRPFSNSMRKYLKFPPAIAALVTVLGLVAVVSGLLTVAGREISTGVGELWDKAQAGFEEAVTWSGEGPLQISQSDLQAYLDQVTDTISDNSGTIVS